MHNYCRARHSSFCTDTLQTVTPLVNKVLLTWLTTSFVYYRATEEERVAAGLEKPRGIGYGIGLAFAIFAMQGTSCVRHYPCYCI